MLELSNNTGYYLQVNFANFHTVPTATVVSLIGIYQEIGKYIIESK